MADGTRAQEQKRVDESLKQLRETSEKHGLLLSDLSKMMAAITAHIFSIQVEGEEAEEVNREPEDLEQVLHHYRKVFDKPKGLPPQREHDHKIPLEPGSMPPNIRPYRYPYVQKSEIEKLVQEMLENGTIRKSNQLFVKKSKCAFGKKKIEYLGHVISDEGVATDPAKIQNMLQWPKPNSLKSLRGFLGLTGYYRRFIKDYGKVSQPLTVLLKKDNFQWTQAAKDAFDQLKHFVIECDASGNRIGAVLLQEGRPIAYLSKALAPKNLGLSTYEKEMLAAVMAVQKWRPYVVGKHFKIITDHLSLKFLLDQRVSTPMQHKWLTKLADRSELKKTILQEAHGGVEGGHSRVKKTLERVRRAFYWKKMRREVCKFVAECDTCQRNKAETIASPGLLQPLPIPELIWSDISMDFIEGLPKSHGKKVIMVVVDRLSKYAHFLALAQPYTAKDVAQVFLDNIYKLHGLPKTIISDRDRIFTSTQLLMSTSYHPQTDGQTEIVNKCLEQYLRCMTGDKPKEWSKWLPLAEWWYNTSFHFSSKITPFEVVYGREPPTYTTYIPGETIVASVDQALRDRDSMIRLLKENLHQAQSKMKKMADKHRTKREFEVDDWVYLRLQPFKQASLALRKNRKLAPKFYGPYKVLQRIGQVAYKLELPSHSKIHPVFHVSCLKKKLGAANVQQTELPTIQEDGRMQLEPLALLEKRTVKRNNRPVVQWLIHWTNSFPEDATWEDACVIRQKFPEFAP
ncbi:hypothetical protein KPL71_017914 [Citrus sinensis]|uniref:Uncharacterized protein n=1 Tax=Citrus sinensis TaxID=2711 RepID=A0ACB8JTQ3_CITSI|nr:hypothetical protein KPL71_017914 [Citrus sinensis]